MPAIRSLALAAAAASAVLTGLSAQAQDFGDAARGERIATGVCLACHGVRRGESSNNPLAPPFAAIAEVRGMSPVALNVALLSPHRAMPNLVLDAQERADVIAYIMRLKTP